MKYFNEIFEYVKELEIIDTHEHLPHREELRNSVSDVLEEYLGHYFIRDLVSAGLTQKELEDIHRGDISVKDKWKIVEPYWEIARYTGYGRSLDISAQELYGIDRIDGTTVEELDKKFRQSFGEKHFNKVLKEKSNIKISLLDHPLAFESDYTYYRPVMHIDHLIFLKTAFDIKLIENETNTTITSFNAYIQACDKIIYSYLEKGIIAYKCGLAYMRPLKFDRFSAYEAEKEFNKIFSSDYYIYKSNEIYSPGKSFQDYMMHHILDILNENNAILQLHTGIQEGNGNIIYNSNPEQLSNLFMEYPNVTFDVFHIGFPYQNVLSAIGKMFPNVFIDMCWAHIISPPTCIRILGEWLETMPYNKISAFGGDYCFIDGVYGHQYLARENVSKVLAQKVEENLFDIKTAKKIAKDLFYNNPVNIFKLKL